MYVTIHILVGNVAKISSVHNIGMNVDNSLFAKI